MIVLGEGGEVVAAREQGGGISHGLDIQPILDPPDVAFVECRLAGGDLVDVGAGDGVVAGMEVRMGLLNG